MRPARVLGVVPRRRADSRRLPEKGKLRDGPPAPFAPRLVVMVRWPEAGRVKTRLARDVGPVRATSFYRNTMAAVLQRITRGPWETWLAVAPDRARQARAWPAHVRRVPQGQGDLGARMQRLMDRLPPGPAVIVGSDIPALTAGHVMRAFAALGRHDAVFGPARDGGYWLVGLRRRPHTPRAFAAVRWSSPDALADTCANLARHRVAFLDPLEDVDEGADLACVSWALGRRVLPVVSCRSAAPARRSPSDSVSIS